MSDFVSILDILRDRTLTKPKDKRAVVAELIAIQMLRKRTRERGLTDDLENARTHRFK